MPAMKLTGIEDISLYAQSLKPPPPKLLSSIPVQLVQLGKKRDPKLLPRAITPSLRRGCPSRTIK